jgi:hypothetical protein
VGWDGVGVSCSYDLLWTMPPIHKSGIHFWNPLEVHIAQRYSIIPDGRVVIRMMVGKTDQHVLTWALNHDAGLVKCKTF